MDKPPTPPSPSVELLTKREREALRLVSEHRLSKEIGPLMGVSKSRADALVESACRKLGVSGRRAAARMLAAHDAPTPSSAEVRLLPLPKDSVECVCTAPSLAYSLTSALSGSEAVPAR